MYYTPKEIQNIIDPSTGTGVFMKNDADSIVGNPPYSVTDRSFDTMNNKDQVKKFSKWFDKVDGLKDMIHLPLTDLLQMAFSAGIEAREQSECVWSIHDEEANAWEGDCGLVWFFEVGGAKENEMNFCPKCGRHLVQREQDSAPTESDDE